VADVLQSITEALRAFLLEPSDSLPAATLSITQINDKPIGLGNWRGNERRGGITTVALKGGRLSGLARFLLWADTPAAADGLADGLHGRLLAAKDDLRVAGFLKLFSQAASLPQHAPSLDAWHKTLDYEFLYEYHYEDSDGAESLIATIPIHADLEQLDSPERESSVVSDALVRWDETAAPALTLAGRVKISRLLALVFIPGPMPGGPVALVRTFAGATAPPTDYATLEQFMAAVSQPHEPERNGRFVFPSLTEFLAVFATTGDLIALGDWDESGLADPYEARQLAWTPPIHLAAGIDRLQVVYAPGSSEPKFDQSGIVYLRAGP
jgi:hypothetical protein